MKLNKIVKTGLILGFTFFYFTNIIVAQQGNYRFNNYGNRSILLAGNVTGSVSDLGLTYYNPSFLTDIEDAGFSINAQGYQLVKFKLNNVLNERSQLKSKTFNGTSAMAGGIFNLFGTKFAYTYLTKSNHNYNLNYSSSYLNDNIFELFPDALRHKANIGLNSDIKDDWTGLTWAHRITDNFSLGISAFASIYKYKGRSDLNHTVESEDNQVAYYQSVIGFEQKSYGLFFKIGGNYSFRKYTIGFNINLPYVTFYNKGKFSYSEVVSGVSSEFNKFIDYDFKDLTAQRREPFGFSIGAAIPIDKLKMYFNLDFVSSLKKYDRIVIPDIDLGDEQLVPVNFDESRKQVFNFGVGGEYVITEKLKAYGGFTTDFNAFEDSANIFDLSTEENKDITIGEDFYHFSIGADWKLNWISLIMGITYTGGKSEFISPYQINAEGFAIENNLNSQLTYTRWQFIVGIDVPVLGKKMREFIDKTKEEKDTN